VVVAASNWPPYTGSSLTGGGFLTEIVIAAFSKVGYKPEIHFVPWKRGVEMTKTGVYDTLLGASYTKERTAYFLYPKFVWENSVYFYGRSGSVRRFVSLEDLCPRSIGTFRGSFYTDRLRNVHCLNVQEVESIAQNIKKLVSGRIDLFIDSKDAVDYVLKNELPEYENKIEPMQPTFERDKVYLVISRKHPRAQQILEDFDRGISLIKADGTYRRILTAHGMEPVTLKKKICRKLNTGI
jgi:polar amino acid transport system substrate-binding protein